MSQSFQFIISERQRDTTTIWLNNPERLNVLTLALMEELTQAFVDAGESDATGVILAAKGRLFSAGHDFAEMANQDLETVRHLFGVCTAMMQTIQSIPQPVVARVHAPETFAAQMMIEQRANCVVVFGNQNPDGPHKPGSARSHMPSDPIRSRKIE